MPLWEALELRTPPQRYRCGDICAKEAFCGLGSSIKRFVKVMTVARIHRTFYSEIKRWRDELKPRPECDWDELRAGALHAGNAVEELCRFVLQ